MPYRSRINEGGIEAMLRAPEMRAALQTRAKRVKQRAQVTSPVRTGRYKRSWYYRTLMRDDKWVARAGNRVFYAYWLEKGTRYMYARRVLTRAMQYVRR